jgi:hypothetical protein
LTYRIEELGVKKRQEGLPKPAKKKKKKKKKKKELTMRML